MPAGGCCQAASRSGVYLLENRFSRAGAKDPGNECGKRFLPVGCAGKLGWLALDVTFLLGGA